MTGISIDGVVRRFGQVNALKGVSLDVAAGEFVALVGPSGCGKTTLMRIVAGIETSDAGTTLQAGRMIPWYAFPGTNSVRVTQVMVDTMARVVEGRATPEQVLPEMAAEVRRLLPRRS